MLNKQDIKEILAKRFSNDLHKKISQIPLPRDLKDVYKAAFRIKEAIENSQMISIVGDYDVDGVVSSVIVSDFFDFVGANYDVKIPNRFTDGYGLNADIISQISANLILTVDNGISANEAAEICAKKGIDLIITDHHVPPPVLPKAYAIVNPKQADCPFPDIEICGAQVAWYLVGALKDVCKTNYDMSESLDILCLAIISDMMELRDLNRLLVKAGLNKLNISKRPCFKAIKNESQKMKFDYNDISFMIDPLINSAGRMDDAMIAYKFLRSKNIKEATRYLYEIKNFNNSRKLAEKELLENCFNEIDDDENIIVVWGENWHEGVIGIVASRLAKKYKKPAIVFSIDGTKAKGSARSVGKFDILSLISTQKDILLTFGGHKGAAGIGIKSENLAIFKEKINQISKHCNTDDFLNTDEILGLINHNEIDFELFEILDSFEPYGQKNPRPYFKIYNAYVQSVSKIGKNSNHLKLNILVENRNFEVIFYNFDLLPKIGDFIDIIFYISKNSYSNKEILQLLARDIRISPKH